MCLVFNIKAYTAEQSIKQGVDIINDVSGLRHDSQLIKVVVDNQIPYIYTHSRGEPSIMLNPQFTDYKDIIKDLIEESKDQLQRIIDQSVNK